MNAARRTLLIEQAYYRDKNDLADQIVMCDEELTGVRPATMDATSLTECLDYWLGIANVRWATQSVLAIDNASF